MGQSVKQKLSSLFKGSGLSGGSVPIVGQRHTPAGTIGILTAEHGRYARFWLSQLSLQPPGHAKLLVKFTVNIPEGRNEIIREAEGEWVWFIDDDHTFDSGLLTRLLAREVDVVQPLVLSRYAPFGPVVMGPRTPDGNKHWRFALTPRERGGLKEVFVAGAAGMLLRRRVWEAIPPPWFTAGELNPEIIGEDVTFSRRVTGAGFRIYCDLDNRMGHLNVGEVWPVWNEESGEWETEVRFGMGAFRIPAAAPSYYLGEDGKTVYNIDGTLFEGEP
jgi:hypothetical protein